MSNPRDHGLNGADGLTGRRGKSIINKRMRSIRNYEGRIMGHQSLTAQRRLLYKLIHESDEHVDAKELYRRASNLDRSISLATVYRGLRFFKESGLVNERRFGQVHCYEVKGAGEHQHMVCERCGRVIEFESPLLAELIDRIRHDQNFQVTRVELCLEGYCRECQPESEVR
ncbi:Fur family transcriptional regulator [Chloroflexota bacterium]